MSLCSSQGALTRPSGHMPASLVLLPTPAPPRSELFNVNYFVVSQCNPYVLPLVSESCPPLAACSSPCLLASHLVHSRSNLTWKLAALLLPLVSGCASPAGLLAMLRFLGARPLPLPACHALASPLPACRALLGSAVGVTRCGVCARGRIQCTGLPAVTCPPPLGPAHPASPSAALKRLVPRQVGTLVEGEFKHRRVCRPWGPCFKGALLQRVWRLGRQVVCMQAHSRKR